MIDGLFNAARHPARTDQKRSRSLILRKLRLGVG